MRTAFYVRVSTERQQQAQTIEQEVALLRAYVADPLIVIEEQHLFREDGHTGAKLQRPGLDTLRDQAARAAFEGSVEAWARAADNPVGGWYGLKKGLRGGSACTCHRCSKHSGSP